MDARLAKRWVALVFAALVLSSCETPTQPLEPDEWSEVEEGLEDGELEDGELAELPPGTLTITSDDPEVGIAGLFVQDDVVISLETRRRELVVDGEFVRYELDARFLGESGHVLAASAGGHAFIDSSWSAAPDAAIDIEQVLQEHDVLASLAPHVRERLGDTAPEETAVLESLIRTVTLTPRAVSGCREGSRTHRFRIFKGPVDLPEIHLHKWLDAIRDVIIDVVEPEHSATATSVLYLDRNGICRSLDPVRFCNHGRCPGDDGMSLSCETYYHYRSFDLALSPGDCGLQPAADFVYTDSGQSCCQTKYGFTDGTHVCNDDTELQRDMVHYDETSTTSFSAAYCQDNWPKPWAPSCITAQCGNGIVENDEQCDDGNQVTETCAYQQSCEICTSACELVAVDGGRCGDGFCQSVAETSSTCPGDCGGAPSCPSNCSDHGTCSVDGVCACDPGYAGSDCANCAAGYSGYPTCTPTAQQCMSGERRRCWVQCGQDLPPECIDGTFALIMGVETCSGGTWGACSTQMNCGTLSQACTNGTTTPTTYECLDGATVLGEMPCIRALGANCSTSFYVGWGPHECPGDLCTGPGDACSSPGATRECEVHCNSASGSLVPGTQRCQDLCGAVVWSQCEPVDYRCNP